MGYQFFLPVVLRWRASRAEAPLKETIDKQFQTHVYHSGASAREARQLSTMGKKNW